MKNFTFLFTAIILSLATFAQAPNGIKYQTVIRDGDGNILPDTEHTLQMTIRSSAPDGIVVYSETHDAMTNALGLVNLVIGNGTPQAGTFAEINWGDGDKYLEIAIDLTGGDNYTVLGVTQLLSVPYAFESNHSQSLTLTDENGNKYEISVDTLGNLISSPVLSEWNCGMPFTDSRDGHTYTSVKIGEQCWMAENLAFLPEVSPSSQGSITDPFYYVYNFQGANVTEAKANANYQTFGVLYNWMASLNACPEGWHLSSDEEWTTLTDYVGSQPEYLCNSNTTYIAKALAANINWNSSFDTCDVGNNLSANNATGFTALPGGSRDLMGPFNGLWNNGLWWSSTEAWSNHGWQRSLLTNYGYVFVISYNKASGLSVRCLRDETISPTTYILNLEVVPPEAGTVTGTGQYEADEPLYINAEANPGWEFVNWTDNNGIVNEAANFIYTMPAEDITLTANFVEEQVSFTCGETFTDTRDDQSYATVQIGEQCWMAENLTYLPEVNPPSEGSGTDPYYYVYNYQGTNVAEAKSTTNYQTYGALYNWPASLDACPEGWHLPTNAEWAELTDYISSQPEYNCNGNTDYIAKALADTTNWNPTPISCAVGNNLSANNATGFSGLPGGYRYNYGYFILIGDLGVWLSSTEDSSNYPWSRYMEYGFALIGSDASTKDNGFSVRCLRD